MVVFLEMGEKFVENDFFKDFGQKWKVRNGTVVFQKIFYQVMAFSTEVFTTDVFRSRGTMPVVATQIIFFKSINRCIYVYRALKRRSVISS